jgi:hypothetical protein
MAVFLELPKKTHKKATRRWLRTSAYGQERKLDAEIKKPPDVGGSVNK